MGASLLNKLLKIILLKLCH